MSTTKIQWADKVWNPVTGCTPISEGCANCYAARMARRLAGRYGYPKDEPFKVTFHPKLIDEPLRWRKPNKVFVLSMGDIFHESVPYYQLDAIWAVMAVCGMDWMRYRPNHDDLTGDEPLQPKQTFIVLTKRPYRMREYLTKTDLRSRWMDAMDNTVGWDGLSDLIDMVKLPLPNVWLGVTAENQRTADERIPILLRIPAAKRFVSVEPMLGPVDLCNLEDGKFCAIDGDWAGEKTEDCPPGIDWVIAGPETGPRARPMSIDWVRDLSNQCRTGLIPFFDKRDVLGETIQEWPR